MSEPVINKVGREKSVNGIRSQMFRLLGNPNLTPARREKIMEIANRYQENIERTKTFKYDSSKSFESRQRDAYDEAISKGYTLSAEANADKALTKKYGRYIDGFYNQYLLVPTRTRRVAVTPGAYERYYSSKVYAKKNNR